MYSNRLQTEHEEKQILRDRVGELRAMIDKSGVVGSKWEAVCAESEATRREVHRRRTNQEYKHEEKYLVNTTKLN